MSNIPWSHKSKVLLVDDNELTIELLKRRLISIGCDVLTCSNSFLVLDKIKEHRPDILVLDLYMPGKSGFEVAREVKSDKASEGISIIAYSSAIMVEDSNRAIEAGCDDFCSKEANLRVLMRKIKNLVG